jgi:hypothetical protein
MAICRRAKAVHGNNFTYTLIESNDIVWSLETTGKVTNLIGKQLPLELEYLCLIYSL